MLLSLGFEGIKSFSGPTSLRFAPLTVFTGTNSSGKSTIFQVLLAIRQSFEAAASHFGGLYLSGKDVSLGSYEDWSSGHLANPIEIRLTLGQSPAVVRSAARPRRPTRSGALRGSTRLVQPWWTVPPRARLLFPKYTASGSLYLRLVAGDPSAPIAHLQDLLWASAVSTEDRKETYRFHLRPAPSTDDVVADGTASSDEVVDEEEDFPFKAEFEYLSPASDGPTNPSAMQTEKETARAAVQGLTPISLMVETEYRAVYRALTSIIAASVNRVRDMYFAHAPGQQGGKSRWRPQTHVPTWNSTLSDFQRAENFLQKCSAADLLAFFASYDLFPFHLVAALEPGSVQAFDFQSNAGARLLAQAAFSRLRDLLGEFVPAQALDAPRQVDGSSVTTDAAYIVEKLPPFGSIIQFALDVVQLLPRNETSDTVRLGIARAASDIRQDRRIERQMPAQGWLDRKARHLGSDVRCPTEDDLRSFFVDLVFHLGPLRDEPRNLYTSDLPSTMADVGTRGERAVACLRHFGKDSVLCPVFRDSVAVLEVKSLASAVEFWGAYLGLYTHLDLNVWSKYGTVFRVAVGSGPEAVHADLTNVGVGVSQLLPVLTLCLAAPVGSTLLIEQPELHLHPAVQTRLAYFFVACALTGRQIAIETHSEHLVNGFRLIASEKGIEPDEDLALSYIERERVGSGVTEIKVGNDGSIDRWPAHFFDESERVLAQIMRNRLGE